MGITDRVKAGLAAFGLAAGLQAGSANAQTIDPNQYDLNKIGADKLQMYNNNSALGKPQSVTNMAQCLEQATTEAKAQNTDHGQPNSRLAIWALCSKDGKPVATVHFHKAFQADNLTIKASIAPKNMAVFDAANKGIGQRPNGIPEELIPQGRRGDRLRRAMEAHGTKPSGPSNE